mgnify:CR=1 FL=1|jgi:hypothetical protein
MKKKIPKNKTKKNKIQKIIHHEEAEYFINLMSARISKDPELIKKAEEEMEDFIKAGITTKKP